MQILEVNDDGLKSVGCCCQIMILQEIVHFSEMFKSTLHDLNLAFQSQKRFQKKCQWLSNGMSHGRKHRVGPDRGWDEKVGLT